MALSAGALQLAGFLMVHGFWTISEQAPAEPFFPQALCETQGGERRLQHFDAPTLDESYVRAQDFLKTSAPQFAYCAFVRQTELALSDSENVSALVIELSGSGQGLTILQVYSPSGSTGGFRLMGNEVVLQPNGMRLSRGDTNAAIVSLREGAADHPGTEGKWADWNKGRDLSESEAAEPEAGAATGRP